MGNYKFKFSNMLPNAWFYKLKYTTPIKTKSLNSSYYRKTHHKTSSFAATATVAPLQAWRQSYHFQRELNYERPTQSFTEEPRKATKKRRSTKKTRACHVNSSASSHESFLSKSELIPEKYPSYSPDSSCFDDSGFSDLDSEFERQKVDSLSEANHNYVKFEKEFDLVSELELKPIITKKIDNERDHEIPAAAIFQRTRERSSHSDKSYTKKHRKAAAKKMTVNSPGGAKVKNYHPKTGTKRGGQVHGQKNISSAGQKNVTSEMKNVIIVKDSIDPGADFKESMVEMILENNIRTSKDLEKLLVCYLSLNSAAYHSRIVKIFEQIWFQITDI